MNLVGTQSNLTGFKPGKTPVNFPSRCPIPDTLSPVFKRLYSLRPCATISALMDFSFSIELIAGGGIVPKNL